MGLGAALGALLVISFSPGPGALTRGGTDSSGVKSPVSRSAGRLWALPRVGVGFGGLRWGGGSSIPLGSRDTRRRAPVPSGLRLGGCPVRRGCPSACGFARLQAEIVLSYSQKRIKYIILPPNAIVGNAARAITFNRNINEVIPAKSGGRKRMMWVRRRTGGTSERMN